VSSKNSKQRERKDDAVDQRSEITGRALSEDCEQRSEK